MAEKVSAKRRAKRSERRRRLAAQRAKTRAVVCLETTSAAATNILADKDASLETILSPRTCDARSGGELNAGRLPLAC